MRQSDVARGKAWGNEAVRIFFFCYAARIPILSGYSINQYEEAPYRRQKMSYMKTPPLDVLLRYILQVVYPPENVDNIDDSEVVVNEQSPHNPPPAPTTRSLSYPPPQLLQPLRKYSFHCSLLFPTFPNPSLNCTALLPSLSSALPLTSTSHVKLSYVRRSALEFLEWWA